MNNTGKRTNNMNKKTTAVQSMLEIADEYITTFRSDIVLDFEKIYCSAPTLFMWAVRKTGTWMADVNDTRWHDTMCYKSIATEQTERCFLVDTKSGTVKEISREVALGY